MSNFRYSKVVPEKRRLWGLPQFPTLSREQKLRLIFETIHRYHLLLGVISIMKIFMVSFFSWMDNITWRIASHFIQTVFSTVFHFDFLPARKYFLKYLHVLVKLFLVAYTLPIVYSPSISLLLMKVRRHSIKVNGLNCLKKTQPKNPKQPRWSPAPLLVLATKKF